MKSPKTIVITGASSGIGKALAELYAQPKIHLALIARNQVVLNEISTECQRKGATVSTAAIDVRNQVELAQWLINFDQNYPIDLIIANAGITSSINAEKPIEEWKTISEVIEINFYGVLNTIYPLIPLMRQRQYGQIAIVSSLAGYRGMPAAPIYGATKAGLNNYAQALRGILKYDQIEVNLICPGFVKSALSDRFLRPKPWIISASEAAYRIQQGLMVNRACISFPFPLNWAMKGLSILPDSIANRLLELCGYGVFR